MRPSRKLKLSPFEKFLHFFPVLFLLFLAGLDFFYTVKGTLKESFPAFGFACLILALAAYFWQAKRLFFKHHSISYTENEFNEALNRTIQKLEWNIIINSGNIVKAERAEFLAPTYADQITIIKLDGALLLNSVSFFSTFSFGRNRQNLSTLLKNLEDVKAGLPNPPEKEEHPLKIWLIRLFIYPICFVIFFCTYLVFSNPIDASSISAVLGCVVFASIYIYSDIKVIIRNSKHKKKR